MGEQRERTACACLPADLTIRSPRRRQLCMRTAQKTRRSGDRECGQKEDRADRRRLVCLCTRRIHAGACAQWHPKCTAAAHKAAEHLKSELAVLMPIFLPLSLFNKSLCIIHPRSMKIHSAQQQNNKSHTSHSEFPFHVGAKEHMDRVTNMRRHYV